MALIDDLNEIDREVMGDHDHRERLWSRVQTELEAFSDEEWALVRDGARDALVRLVRRDAHVYRVYDHDE